QRCNADKYLCSTAVEGGITHSGSPKDLFLGFRQPNRIDGVINSAATEFLNRFDGVACARVTRVGGTEARRKGELLLAHVYGDDRMGIDDGRRRNRAEPDAAGAEYG